MIQKPRAVFVGPDIVAQAFADNQFVDWDFVAFTPGVNELYEGVSLYQSNLEQGIDPSTLPAHQAGISTDIEAIVLSGNLFDPSGNSVLVEDLICTYGPYVYMGILEYGVTKEQLDERVQHYLDTRLPDQEFNDLNYYLISRDNPIVDFETTMRRFIEHGSPSAKDTIDVLTGAVAESHEEVAVEEELDLDPFAGEGENPYIGKIVAVTSSKGGVGKSTTSMATAAYLGLASNEAYARGDLDRPLKICVVDMDVYDGQVSFLVNESAPTIPKMWDDWKDNGRVMSEEIVRKNSIAIESLGATVILASKRPSTHRGIGIDFYLELLSRLRRMYDYIVLDTSVQYLEEALSEIVYPQADRIIFVSEPVVTSVYSMTRWIRYVSDSRERNGLGISKSRVGIVVNKYLGKVAYEMSNLTPEKIQEAAQGVKIVSVIPSSPSGINSAANNAAMERVLDLPGIRNSVAHIANFITEPDGVIIPPRPE